MTPCYARVSAALLIASAALISTAHANEAMTTPHGARGDENATNSGGAGTGDGKRRSHTMPAIELKSDKLPLHLSAGERSRIAEAIAREHTYQRTPKNFEPRIGLTVKKQIKLNPMPRPLVYQLPVLRQYDYAKLQYNILVIDPMNLKIVEIIPRKFPTVGKPISPMEWWSTRGRSLVGLPPEPVSAAVAKPQAH